MLSDTGVCRVVGLQFGLQTSPRLRPPPCHSGLALGPVTQTKKTRALARGWKGDGGFALGGNHKHSEIPKQGDSWAGRMGLTQEIAPARPKSRGWAVTPHIPME